jgi:hypothetical protein
MIQWMAARAAARTWWPAVVGAAAIFSLAFMLGQCSGVEIQKNRQAKAEVSAITKDSAAKIQAAGERARDDAAITKLEKDLRDAASGLPDAAPSERLRRFDCQRLRNDGVDVSGVPGCG